MSLLDAYLDERTLVLTANKRLSAAFLDAFMAERVYDDHNCVLPSPKVLPLNSWFIDCFERLEANAFVKPLMLLNDEQARFVWKHVLLEASSKDLHDPFALTKSAISAFSLLSDFKLPIQGKPEFIAWSKAFLRASKEHGWMDLASLPSWLYDAFEQDLLDLPARFVFVGFLEFVPAVSALINLFKRKGCECLFLEHIEQKASRKNDAVLFEANDTETEIYAMARWAKKQLELEVNAKIGCIVPRLPDLRDQVTRIFEEVFNAPLFNLSGGTPLLQEPLVEMAFEILALKGNLRSIQEIGHLLRSPFVGDYEKESSERALFDAKLRSCGNLRYDLKALCRAVVRAGVPLLKEKLEALLHLELPLKALPSVWAKYMMDLLLTMGWPGKDQVNAHAFQVLSHFQALLTRFCTLDDVSGALSFAQALFEIRSMASYFMFQEATPNKPIQILGELEGIGLSFSHLWIMGMDDRTWPPMPKPNPLLPFTLQREKAMPHACPSRELAFCKKLKNHYLKSASNIVVSFARQEEDRFFEPCALFKTLKRKDDLPLAAFTAPDRALFGKEALVSIEDNVAPAVSEGEVSQGGSAIFKDQSLCPFRSFVHHRLHAKALEVPQSGLSVRERGVLVHKALELFWRSLKTQEALKVLDGASLRYLAAKVSDQALAAVTKGRQLSKRYLALEKARMMRILQKLFELEKKRAPFEVCAVEKRMFLTFGGLHLNVQVDRIDRLLDEHGGIVLIDYKTGQTDSQKWFSKRPDEPQLLLYAVACEEAVCAIIFSQLVSSDVKFKGVGACFDEALGVQNIMDMAFEDDKPLTWQMQLNRWQEILRGLSESFCAGDAAVDPKDPKDAKACQFCDLGSLCRIHKA